MEENRVCFSLILESWALYKIKVEALKIYPRAGGVVQW
jgi:hypothetical protein